VISITVSLMPSLGRIGSRFKSRSVCQSLLQTIDILLTLGKPPVASIHQIPKNRRSVMKKSLVILILTLIAGFAQAQQAGYKQTNLVPIRRALPITLTNS
jgi:hypothetical protein